MKNEIKTPHPLFLSNSKFHIIILIITALLFRLHNFRQGEVLVSSDEVFALETSLKPLYGILSNNLHTLLTQLFRFFNYPWGWTSLLGSTITLSILHFFNIPITEFTMNIPHVITGIFSIIALYALCIVLTGKKLIAFFSAFILAILPIHVALSRSITTNGVYSTTLFFTTLLFFISYFKTIDEKKRTTKNHLAIGMLSLGLYLGADNQFPGILVVIFFSGILFIKNKNISEKINIIIKTFLSKYILLFFLVILPLILGAIYLATKGMIKSAYLNLFHSKKLVIGMYYPDFFQAVYDDAGPVLLIIFIISFIYNLVALLWKKEQKTVRLFIFIWFIITALPWLFLLSAKVAWFQLYILQPLMCLIISTALFFNDLLERATKIKKKNTRIFTTGFLICAIIIIFLITIASTSNLIYKTNYFGWKFTPVFGQVGENIGIKTIGYYVREKTSPESVIFIDVESFVGQYYFQRKIIGDLDLTDEQIYNQLFFILNTTNNEEKNQQKNIINTPFNYAFIHNTHFTKMDPVLEKNNYQIIAQAVNKEGQIMAKLYGSSNTKSKPLILPIEEYDSLFDTKYGYLNHLYIDFG